MPETGNKTNSHKKILSIRLWRGGLSFYIAADARRSPLSISRVVSDSGALASALEDALGEVKAKSGSLDFDTVQVFVDTADTVFIPAELIESADLKELLEGAGIVIAPGRVIIESESVNGVGAASVFDGEPIEALQAKFRGRLRFFSPLHELLAACERMQADRRKDIMCLYPTACNIYMLQFDADGKLILAEAYPCCGESDAVYYCSELIPSQRAHKVSVLVYGERAARYVTTLKKYFRKAGILTVK